MSPKLSSNPSCRGVEEPKSEAPLEVAAPPLYIQEKVHPKALIDDLLKESQSNAEDAGFETPDLFSDFNGLPDNAKSADFYQHDGHWQNRMILGDGLQVMASLAEREGLRGKVQCIYLDPPYGIKFNSNFQWSTTSRDVKDGKADHISREPEQVKAFRDTWRDGIHSYLTYLRDRLLTARDLLTDSGSIFVQIGDENVHRVRALMDEVFGEENAIATVTFKKTGYAASNYLPQIHDYILWYSKALPNLKFRTCFTEKTTLDGAASQFNLVEDQHSFSVRPATQGDRGTLSAFDKDLKLLSHDNLTSDGFSESSSGPISFKGGEYRVASGQRIDRHWKTTPTGLRRMDRSNRLMAVGKTLRQKRYLADFAISPMSEYWDDTVVSGFADPKRYVVQTSPKVIERCILMATDPGDLVLDPTCGSGTTAYVAEQWGRRWITIDTSRVALALARARIMGARYPYYLLADSRDGQLKEAELTRTAPRDTPTQGNLNHGFVYERVPHITLKSIANNAEIDVIWDDYQTRLEPLRTSLNQALKQSWEEWEIPREAEDDWSAKAQELHAEWWKERIARQKEIDASIAAKADSEFLYDKPYEDKNKVRVAGPFTVESISPHRTLHVDENDEVIDTWKTLQADTTTFNKHQDFTTVILENLKTAGVQQAHKEDRITFTNISPFPGKGYVCAEATYTEGQSEDAPTAQTKRAAIFIGPEFGTVSREDLVRAAREAGDLNADVLIACAFNYDAHSSEFERLGKVPVLKARMNADLHMADDLKNTGKGNLFVIFGEPDITIQEAEDDQIEVKLNGVDVFKPSTGEVVSSDAKDIACWFIDTDYNEESFFVRHAYFLGQSDPYKSLKTTLKAQIDADAWATLNSDTSRPFPKPKTGRLAVKVINHLGDEVMKVFSV